MVVRFLFYGGAAIPARLLSDKLRSTRFIDACRPPFVPTGGRYRVGVWPGRPGEAGIKGDRNPNRAMADGPDTDPDSPDSPITDEIPRVACSRCNREWELDYELDELRAGNRAVEMFALDHERHTGHFPDDVTPWIVDCRRCRDRDAFLAERPARRWAETHARHTGHAVDLRPPTDESSAAVIGDR